MEIIKFKNSIFKKYIKLANNTHQVATRVVLVDGYIEEDYIIDDNGDKWVVKDVKPTIMGLSYLLVKEHLNEEET